MLADADFTICPVSGHPGPYLSQEGTTQAPAHFRGQGLLHGRAECRRSVGCSLTCRDGAVSCVVVKSVEVFAALRTKIKRTWNTEEGSHEDSRQKGAGRAEE